MSFHRTPLERAHEIFSALGKPDWITFTSSSTVKNCSRSRAAKHWKGFGSLPLVQ